MENPVFHKELIAPCGMNCGVCIAKKSFRLIE